MAKQLKDILKQAHDTIKGVKASTTSQGELGKDPGVDYDPKAGDEQEFVAAHSVEKHDDRVGNKNSSNATSYSMDDQINQRMGHKKGADEKAYFKPVKEAKEEMKCNHSPKGTACPVHGLGECWSMKPIKENEVNEVITKKTPTSDVIHDFVHSKNPKFAGKSKDERIKMALGAKYSMMRKEEVEELKEMPSVRARQNASRTFNVDKQYKMQKDRTTKKAYKLPGEVTKKELSDLADKANKVGKGGIVKEDGYPVQPLLGGTSDIAKYKTDDTQAEIEMVRTELKAIANKAMHMVTSMPKNVHVEPWVQAKIAQAKEMIGSVHDYMIYGDHQEEDEQMDTPMTFPNMSVDVNTGQNV